MSIISSLKVRRSIVIAIGVLLASVFVFKKLSSLSKKSPVISSFQSVSVLTGVIENKNHPLQISLSGKLLAKNRIDLFAEVNGVLLSSDFREGNTYGIGQAIARIDDRELQASIKSQKSALMSSISQILPDLGMDYPASLELWKAFHRSITFDKPLPPLPVVQDEQLKLFLSGKNIYANYFNVKSQEERLAKYTMISPFAGVLSAADISPGALVRAGQKMGTFIEPGTYELEASASIDDLRFFKIGDRVALKSNEMEGEWTGVILRINRSMDPSTQMVRVYIGINGNSLREGQYMIANIQGVTLTSVFELPRQYLLEGDQMYFVEKDSILAKKKVDVAYRGVETVFVKNLSNGSRFLNQVVSSAFEGMVVKSIGQKAE